MDLKQFLNTLRSKVQQPDETLGVMIKGDQGHFC